MKIIVLKKKYVFKEDPNKRPPKHYAIITYDKYMDKLKRERRQLNYEQKILKCFYPTKFKVDNYEKGTEEYKFWHGKFIHENLKKYCEQLLLDNDGYFPPPQRGYEDSIFIIHSIPMISKNEHERKLKLLKPYSKQ
jgi:hypothetical protein